MTFLTQNKEAIYTIIDIETTGGMARSHRIIEVAIVTVENNKIVDTYSTLINPQTLIPPFITSLTGINDQMVKNAPTFEEVAEVLKEKTEEKVFVAHNVNFDYNFLKKEFSLLGQRFDRKKLCTVRLAKKIIPGLRSYGLGSLTNSLGITIDDRHRAMGDALATAEVWKILAARDKNDFISHSLKRNSKEATLPANLPREVFEGLPEKTGVYYFHNGKGKVVYVGKAKNIRSRIVGHFTGDSSNGKRLFHENVHDISYELTGNELIALLMESREIKRLWPEFNRAQKYTGSNYGLYEYSDRSGYRRLAISRIPPGTAALCIFNSFAEGRNLVSQLVTNFQLCAKLCGLQKSKEACFDFKIGRCDGACNQLVEVEEYNRRFAAAVASFREEKKTYAIIGEGRGRDERTVVLVENGNYLGFGFADTSLPAQSFADLQNYISSFPDNQDIQKILNMYLKKPKENQVIYF